MHIHENHTSMNTPFSQSINTINKSLSQFKRRMKD